MKWTNEQARRYLINYHFLHQQASSIQDVMDRLHTIQYDPLNVVGTNPELVLQARVDGFQAEDLDRELYQNRWLIDGWDKQMSIYKTEDFLKLEPLRDARAAMELSGLNRYLGMDIEPYIDEIIERFRSSGPLFSRDIQLGESLSHKWGRTKPSSATIDYLFHKGILGVSTRQRSHKQYDLLERLIPSLSTHQHIWDTDEFIDWYLLRRVHNAGLCWNKSSDLYGGLFLRKKTDRTIHFKRLVDQGRIKEVEIEGLSDICYIPADIPLLSDDIPDRMTFLAPLDNLNWDRSLMEELFGFYYRWEVYTPVKKRQYGYYVLPILYQDQLIGRIEFDHFKGGQLVVKHVWWEPGVHQEKMKKHLNKALNRFITYLGATSFQAS